MFLSFCRGKSENIAITDEKARFNQEEINRMMAEAQTFAEEDEAQRKHIESFDSLSSFVYGPKTQLVGQVSCLSCAFPEHLSV